MDNSVCCKNMSVGKGESILVSENATRRVFKYKSIAAGEGIQLSSNSDEIVISRVDNSDFLESDHDGVEFNKANIILAHGVTLSNCTFKQKSNISGYGIVKDCIFMDETTIDVKMIHYTTDCKFYNTTLSADKIIIDGCTLRKVSSIKCNELKMKTASIISPSISIQANVINCEESVISSADTFISANHLLTVSYTSPLFDGKLLRLHCNYVECKAKLCSVKEVNIISTEFVFSAKHAINAKIVKLSTDIRGSLDIIAETIIVNSTSIELNSCKWEVSGSLHLLANKLNCKQFNINAVNSCVSCNIFDATISGKLFNLIGGNSSIIKIEKMQTDDILVELEGTTHTCLGGDWSTTADNLVKIGKNNTGIQLLPSFLESVKTPFLVSEYTKIKTLPTVSNKSSICVSHIPPQNFSVIG